MVLSVNQNNNVDIYTGFLHTSGKISSFPDEDSSNSSDSDISSSINMRKGIFKILFNVKYNKFIIPIL